MVAFSYRLRINIDVFCFLTLSLWVLLITHFEDLLANMVNHLFRVTFQTWKKNGFNRNFRMDPHSDCDLQCGIISAYEF